MPEIKVCPSVSACKIYAYLRMNEQLDCMRRYCLGFNENCARWQVKITGEPVPLDLMPDGTYRDVTEFMPPKPKPEAKPEREKIHMWI